MLYNYIKEHYKEAEPIFLADLLIKNITESELNLAVGPNADMVARYRFISKGDNVDGFYAGNTFANQIGISVQVPYEIEIVSNNASDDGEVLIGNRRFVVRKPVVPITKENVHVLQMLELFIKEYPPSALEYYYELGLEHVLA